jgi:hypothetical protein
MRDEHRPSPLPPDPAGREDIMSDEPREDGTTGGRDGSPMPPDAAGRGDVLGEEPQDGTATSS